MKRILSFSLTAVMAFSAYSQSLWTDNFETYNVGNLNTQGGWARDGGGNANWTQVANIDAAHGKSFKLASIASNEGVWHYHTTNWNAKASANNIFVLEFDYYTGTGGAGGAGVVQIYDVDAGYEQPFEIGWSQDDGYLYIADQLDGEILVDQVTTNTWYHIKAAYDKTTGEVSAQVNGGEVVSYFGVPDLNPQELDVLLSGISTSGFDNIVASATNADPFMAVSDATKKSSVSIFPNPATDVLNIQSANKIDSVSIFDASGKAVKTTTETTINVANLAKGSYVVSIKYADGTKESKKVIKK